jgi:2-dehydro-3-deoxy-L-rhamnonate dehydrogenase (NAD+)
LLWRIYLLPNYDALRNLYGAPLTARLYPMYLFVQAILLLLELRSGKWRTDSCTSSPAVSEKSSPEWMVYGGCMNQIDLRHRHAVVTGGAQGIGLSIATRLVSSGASVSLWDRDGEVLSAAVKQLGKDGIVSAEIVDVSDAASVAAATDATVRKYGKVDILIANAGIAGPNHKTWEYPIDTWKQVVDINLVGVFLCCHAIVPHMLRQGYGRIVNVASIAGKEGNANASAYSASKAGVIAFTKSLGKETANQNIAVNCITPAAARTRLFDQITKEHIDFMLSRIPRGRFLELGEVSAMVAWLVSEENSFTTAAVFDLSGGRATY